MNSSRDRDLSSEQRLSEALLTVMEVRTVTDGLLLAPADALYLSGLMELDADAAADGEDGGSVTGADRAEAMVSIATNYLKMASLILEPDVASQWTGPLEDGVRGGGREGCLWLFSVCHQATQTPRIRIVGKAFAGNSRSASFCDEL